MKFHGFRETMNTLFSFSKSERRGILMLLPLLIVVGIIISALNKPSIEKSFPLLADRLIDSAAGGVSAFSERGVRGDRYGSGLNNVGSGGGGAWYDGKSGAEHDDENKPQLFQFDPNTIDYRGLRRLGFSKQSAAALINYRTKYKKVFELPTDFAACYQVTDSIFDRLEPYIVIGNQFRSNVTTKPAYAVQSEQKPSKVLFSFDPNTLDSTGFRRLGFSARQTEVILNYRQMREGFRTVEEFGECYSVVNRIDELRPYIVIAELPQKKAVEKLELNSASIDALIKVKGIGSVTAERIVEYRKRLGGFHNIIQLSEISGVTEKNFELFSKEIYVDSSKISKIDINFASAETMESHPYISGLIIRKALKYKQLEGGLRSIEEMIKGKILSKEEAEKLSHYLIFTPFTHD